MAAAKPRARTRKKPEVRREQILDEAIRIIGRLGFNGFSLQELSRRCGLTNAGLLYHFPSKDQLLIALLEDRDRRDAEAVTSMAGIALHRQTSLALDKVLKLLRATIKRNSEAPELVRLYTMLRAEALNPAHPACAYFRDREKRTLAAFTAMVKNYVPQPASTARQLLALIAGLEDQWLRTDQGFDLVKEWDRSVAQILPRP